MKRSGRALAARPPSETAAVDARACGQLRSLAVVRQR